jgi:hypothetical protein
MEWYSYALPFNRRTMAIPSSLEEDSLGDLRRREIIVVSFDDVAAAFGNIVTE